MKYNKLIPETHVTKAIKGQPCPVGILRLKNGYYTWHNSYDLPVHGSIGWCRIIMK